MKRQYLSAEKNHAKIDCQREREQRQRIPNFMKGIVSRRNASGIVDRVLKVHEKTNDESARISLFKQPIVILAYPDPQTSDTPSIDAHRFSQLFRMP